MYGVLQHGNGVQRFTTRNGTTLVAFTHRFMAEAVIFKDPWTYDKSNGGGNIVQRFGTPFEWANSVDDKTYRFFGLDPSSSTFDSGVHNVFYRAESLSTALKGEESISLFVNDQGGKSAAYEFALRIVEEDSNADNGDDTVFTTQYVSAPCTFQAMAQGGARAIGNGVFLVASGVDTTGLEAVDASGQSFSQKYTLGRAMIYDPFVRILAD